MSRYIAGSEDLIQLTGRLFRGTVTHLAHHHTWKMFNPLATIEHSNATFAPHIPLGEIKQNVFPQYNIRYIIKMQLKLCVEAHACFQCSGAIERHQMLNQRFFPLT